MFFVPRIKQLLALAALTAGVCLSVSGQRHSATDAEAKAVPFLMREVPA